VDTIFDIHHHLFKTVLTGRLHCIEDNFDFVRICRD